MALRLGALHDALLHPGDPDLAQKAAEEVAAYDARMATLDKTLNTLTWMMGTLIALQIALGVGNLWLTMNVLARLPR